MKTRGSIVIGFMFVGMLIAPGGVIAFEKGENLLSNGDFETDEVGMKPEKWSLSVTG